jgi:hypothetical protein
MNTATLDTMIETARQLDEFRQGYDRAQREFGGRIEASQGSVIAVTEGDGLDVLRDGRPDAAGFRPVEVDVRDYLTTPQILGRVLLVQNRADETMNPAVIVPKPEHPGIIRLARLAVPYVPAIGLTDGLRFGIGLDPQTQAPGFAGHGDGTKQPSPFEPGHFGVVLTAGVSEAHGQALVSSGDKQSHAVIEQGLPQVFNNLGLAKKAPVPTVREVDLAQYSPGQRFPLYWHDSLEDENGGALAEFPGGVDLLIGAAVNSLSDFDLQQAGRYVEYAVKDAGS